MYPIIEIERIKNPRQFYAFPVVGGIVKAVMLIPQYLMLFFAGLCFGIAMLINPFVVLFTGKYWKPAYDWAIKYINIQVKITFFSRGLTDKYPGFTYDIEDNFSVTVNYPNNPNKLFAIPFLGFLARAVVMIPFGIYSQVLLSASNVMSIFSSPAVLFKKYYPESTYELARDAVRTDAASSLYFAGISDTMPTYKISKNHLALKLLFIVLGAILFIFNSSNDVDRFQKEKVSPSVAPSKPTNFETIR